MTKSLSSSKSPITLRRSDAVYYERISGRIRTPEYGLSLIDLFSGAGGLTLGFSPAFGHGFTPVWANDNNQPAANTYNLNFGNHCTVGDIIDILDSGFQIPKADVVVGGPPCQGFSLLNKNRESDDRKQLWRPFLEVVSRSQARVFVMENVPQLLGSEEFHQILTEGNRLGFCMTSGKLLAADFGVPQLRTRAFIIGCKDSDPADVFPPSKTHKPQETSQEVLRPVASNGYLPDALPWTTVREAIGGLPEPQGTEVRSDEGHLDLHFGRTPTDKSLRRYRAIPQEGMNRFDLQRVAPELTPACWIRKTTGGTDLFGRLWWDRPAFTIRTEFFKPEKGRYLHPVQHRPITHREAARIQSFPDEFKFTGSKIEIARQIGNAVPPRLSARIADVVVALLE